MAWTFDGVAFEWLLNEVNGLPAEREFTRDPRLVERPLLDTGDADVALIGYAPWVLDGPIWVSNANAATFRGLNGVQATLSNGSTTWLAVAAIRLVALWVSAEGATGTARFIRPKATA